MSPAPEDLEKTMSTAVIPERWRVVYEAMKPLADRQGASFQFARDKCALIESLGTAEALVRELARALQELEPRTRRVVDCAANGMAIKEIVDIALSRIPK